MPTTFHAESSIAHSVDGEFMLTVPDGSIGAAALADGALTPQKLQKPNAYFQVAFDNIPSVLGNSDETAIRARLILAIDAELVAVRGVCSGKSGTPDPSFNVYKNGVSVLSSAVTLTATDTTLSGNVSNAGGAANDIYTLRATTAAAGGITNLKVVLLFKAAHAA
jgi:hypothetical protein